MKRKKNELIEIDLTKSLPSLQDSLSKMEKPLPLWHELLRAAIFIGFIVVMTFLLMGINR